MKKQNIAKLKFEIQKHKNIIARLEKEIKDIGNNIKIDKEYYKEIDDESITYYKILKRQTYVCIVECISIDSSSYYISIHEKHKDSLIIRCKPSTKEEYEKAKQEFINRLK